MNHEAGNIEKKIIFIVRFSSGFESSEEIKHCHARIPQREEKYKELKGKVQ